jgi:hypothetical protein
MKLCELDYWNGTVLNVAHGIMTGKMLAGLMLTNLQLTSVGRKLQNW